MSLFWGVGLAKWLLWVAIWCLFVVNLNNEFSCEWFETPWWMTHYFHSRNLWRNWLFSNEFYLISYVVQSHIWLTSIFLRNIQICFTFCVIGSPWYLLEQQIPLWCYNCSIFCHNNVCIRPLMRAFIAFRGRACGAWCHSIAIDLLNSFHVSKPSTL